MMATRTISALVALLALSSGCALDGDSDDGAGPSGGGTASAPSGSVDPTTYALDLMRRTYSARYQPFASPAEMLRGVDAVVVGEVASVEPALEAGEGESLGWVMVGLTIKEEWKPADQTTDGVFYYSFRRPTNIDVDVYRKGLPLGTRVVIFANQDQVKWVEGDPGVPVYVAFPQGLFVEVDGRLENVYAPGEDGWPAVSGTETGLEAATLSR